MSGPARREFRPRLGQVVLPIALALFGLVGAPVWLAVQALREGRLSIGVLVVALIAALILGIGVREMLPSLVTRFDESGVCVGVPLVGYSVDWCQIRAASARGALLVVCTHDRELRVNLLLFDRDALLDFVGARVPLERSG